MEPGVDLDSSQTSGVAAALAAAKGAEQVLIFIGIGNAQEHEGIDRHNTSLPGLQEPFTLQVLALCKELKIPAAVVLINGGALAIDPIVPAATSIVEAFYPSVRGAEALALAMFGEENRFGKLPITMYDKAYISQVDFHDFSMSKSPGRTYKYYTGKPLFKFGTGLSYSHFTITCSASGTSAAYHSGVSTTISCSVAHSGGAAVGDEVLQMFHSVGATIKSAAKHPVPIKELVGFERVTVSTASAANVTFKVGAQQLGLVDEGGNTQLVAGEHNIEISNGAGFSAKFPVKVASAKVLRTVPVCKECPK